MAHEKKHQIGISGWCGTGTSTTAKLVCERLGIPWKVVRPASDRFRALARERYPNDPDALNKLEADAQTDLSIDMACDQELQRLAETGQCFIADARLAGMLLPEGLRIYLHCDSHERFRRVAIREGKTFIMAANETILREKLSLARYTELYGIFDLATQSGFHLVLDTGVLSVEDVVDQIVAKFHKFAT